MPTGEYRWTPPSTSLNVLMLGAPGAGAKTFAERTASGPGPLPRVYQYASIRPDFTVATVHNLPFLGGLNTVLFRLWDMPGRRFGVRRTDVRNAAAVIALYDVTDTKSFDVAVRQLTEASEAVRSLERPTEATEALRSVKRDIPMFLVANKCDLLPPGTDSVPGVEDGVREAARLGAEFARSSSGPTPHVEQLLSRVVAAIYGKRALPDTTTVRGFGAKGGGARLPLRPPIARYQQPL